MSRASDELSQAIAYAEDLASMRGTSRSLRWRIRQDTRRSARKVLLIDDDSAMRSLLVATLSAESYELLEAGDIRTAREILAHESPAVIVLDVKLPDGDGIALCQLIKSDPLTESASVILLTASGEEEDRARGLGAGADRYMTKPFRPIELLTAIELLLGLPGSALG